MDPGHKARKNPFDNADLDFQVVGPALRIMQLNVEGLSAAKRSFIQSFPEKHRIDVIYPSFTLQMKMFLADQLRPWQA